MRLLHVLTMAKLQKKLGQSYPHQKVIVFCLYWHCPIDETSLGLKSNMVSLINYILSN